MDIHCGTITIPGLMTGEFGLQDHVKIDYNVPFWEWPEGESSHISPCAKPDIQMPYSRRLGEEAVQSRKPS